MAHSYHEIAFTPTVLDMQARAGSRGGYAAMGGDSRYADALTAREAEFIAQRDSFYMASVSESGWPYVQHRGGPAGFMKVLDDKTIGFADYSGNRQYVSTGNFRTDDCVSLFFMDYPNRRRLKMFGRVRIVDVAETDLLSRLEDPGYGARIERAFLVSVEGFDWNCPAHITPRYTEAEIEAAVASTAAEGRGLAPTSAGEGVAAANDGRDADGTEAVLGNGPVEDQRSPATRHPRQSL
jgi:predicted pyridoxine 5'-phosphate oxidase superfamily flavin-nucleotide-binding protein